MGSRAECHRRPALALGGRSALVADKSSSASATISDSARHWAPPCSSSIAPVGSRVAAQGRLLRWAPPSSVVACSATASGTVSFGSRPPLGGSGAAAPPSWTTAADFDANASQRSSLMCAPPAGLHRPLCFAVASLSGLGLDAAAWRSDGREATAASTTGSAAASPALLLSAGAGSSKGGGNAANGSVAAAPCTDHRRDRGVPQRSVVSTLRGAVTGGPAALEDSLQQRALSALGSVAEADVTLPSLSGILVERPGEGEGTEAEDVADSSLAAPAPDCARVPRRRAAVAAALHGSRGPSPARPSVEDAVSATSSPDREGEALAPCEPNRAEHPDTLEACRGEIDALREQLRFERSLRSTIEAELLRVRMRATRG